MKQPGTSQPFDKAFLSTPSRMWLSTAVALALCLCCAPSAFAAQTAKPSPAPLQNQQPATPQAPVSLASQPPQAAHVTLRDGKLFIKAHNSTLLQILQSVSEQGGMKIQGSPGNHRVFGTYGPGKPSTVLSTLLSGYDFNYLLVGATPTGMPATLMLSTGGIASANNATPPQPVHNVAPAPQNTQPPSYAPRPPYHRPQPENPRTAPSRSAHPRQPAAPHHVPSPQEILKELERMHSKQQKQNK